MALTELLEMCKRSSISLSVEDGDLRIKGKKSAVSAELVAALRDNKQALIAWLAVEDLSLIHI